MVKSCARLRAAAVARRGGGRADAADPRRAGLRRHLAVLPLRPVGGRTRAAGDPGGAESRWSGCSAACRASTGWWRKARHCRNSICTARCSACHWRWGPPSRASPAPCPICTPMRRRSRPGGRASPRWETEACGSAWSWAGNPRNTAGAAVDRRRSIAPDRLAPLFDAVRGAFFSLQKDGPAAPEALPADRFHGRDGRLRRYRGADRQPRPGHLGGHRRCPSGGGVGQAGLAAEPLRSVLALARRAARQPVVSDACASIVSRVRAIGTSVLAEVARDLRGLAVG